MFFKRKTELQRLIDIYGKDKDTLYEFARCVHKPRIEEITPEDVQRYKTEVIEPLASMYRREDTLKRLRKFLRQYRCSNLINFAQKSQISLPSVGENAMIEPMEIKKKNPRGRPANMEMIKKVKFLKDHGKLSLRAIARAEGKSEKTIHAMYHYPNGYKNAKSVGKKLSPDSALA